MTLNQWESWVQKSLAEVEEALDRFVPADAPAGLGDAMRYAVLGGGKRLRPVLVLAACEAVQGHHEAALRAAVAVELIHAYSLVHDDMPCMDDDALRRGKPTVHVKYDEATALLVGDALQAQAFDILSAPLEAELGKSDACVTARQLRMVNLLAQADYIMVINQGVIADFGERDPMLAKLTGAAPPQPQPPRPAPIPSAH